MDCVLGQWEKLKGVFIVSTYVIGTNALWVCHEENLHVQDKHSPL